MNITQALKTGKQFKRKHNKRWLKIDTAHTEVPENTVMESAQDFVNNSPIIFVDNGNAFGPDLVDLMAEDYETMVELKPELFDFSEALKRLKGGKAVTRAAFGTKIIVKLQMPDNHSKMTEPYLYMEKGVLGNGFRRFPLDLGCESIMGTDWYEIR